MKRTLLVLAIVPLVWSVLGGAAVAQGRSNGPLPTQQQLSRLGLERVWWAQAALNPSRDKVEHVVIDEDIVYVQVASGVTTAFDAETGRQKWAIQIGRFDQPSFPAVSNENLALIVCGSTMYAIDKNTGRTAWSLLLSGMPSTAPALDDNQVYFGTLNGSVYAYSLRKIRKLYEERRLPQWSSEAYVWMFKAAKEITSPPITNGRVVNFASLDGSLYSVSADDRKVVYQVETDKAIVAPLARMGNSMFMASEDNSFYSLNLSSGQVEWEFTTGLPIRKTIWAVDRDLYLLPDRGGMYCLNPKTGESRWTQPNLASFLAVLGNMLAATDTDGNLVLVARDKGDIIGSMPVRRFSVRTGNDRTDRIFLATESGLVVCLRQAGHLDPVFHRYPDRLPLMPEFEPETGDDSSSDPEAKENE